MNYSIKIFTMKKLIFALSLLFSVVALMAQQVQRDKVIVEILFF